MSYCLGDIRVNLTPKAEMTLNTILSSDDGGCYIFFGEKNIGKCSFAKELISKKLDTTIQKLGSVLNYQLIQPKEGIISVEQIRSIVDYNSYMSYGTKYVLIDEADKATPEAQECLLKMLEDASEQTMYLLISSERLLATVESRCKKIEFVTGSRMDLYNSLDEPNKIAVAFSNGKIGLYYKLLDDKEYCNDAGAILKAYNTLDNKRRLFLVFKQLHEKEEIASFDQYRICLMDTLVDIYTQGMYVSCGLEPKEFTLAANRISKMYSLAGIQQCIRELVHARSLMKKNAMFDLVRKLVSIQ